MTALPATPAARHTDNVLTPRDSASRSYQAPARVGTTTLRAVTERVRPLDGQQRLAFGAAADTHDITIYYAGDLELLVRPCVAIVGTRKVSAAGAARARRLARELASHGVVIVSGLAGGVDTQAHTAAIECGGRTVAVIGTPLGAAFPAANRRLQETIYREHLLVSQFPHAAPVFPSNFPQRNRVMAAVSDATVIIEASDTSGTLHQAAECKRLGRWLFIAKSILDDTSSTWPASFLNYEKTRVLKEVSDILQIVYGR